MNRKGPDFELQSALSERYTDFAKIGEGGMAVVYKALDTVLLRHVAIKTLSIAMTPDMVARFQREARAASRVQHPNIVTVLDFGLAQDIPYLVMDYAEGENLASFVKKRGRLSANEAVELGSEVCRGMACAHTNKIVHRDLKPGNVMVLDKPEAYCHVKIVDFGIAKIIESPHGGNGPKIITTHGTGGVTSTGQLIGSPFYMSPEQIRGQKIDQRTDIYSFGCMLYEMLCGSPPFRGENQLNTFDMHLSCEPPPIAVPDLSPRLIAVVMQCLEKDAADRPDSMLEVAELLSRSLDREPLTAESIKPDESTNQSRLPARRIFVAAAATAAALGLGTTWLSNSGSPPKAQSDSSSNVPSSPDLSFVPSQVSTKKVDQVTQVTPPNPVADDLIQKMVRSKSTRISLKELMVTNAQLARLADCGIKDLDLTRTNTNDSAAPVLSRFLLLKSLNLTQTRLTDSGMEKLVLPGLTHLEIDDLPKVTDRGLESLVRNCPNLEFLKLSHTSISPKGILGLRKLHRLKYLEIAGLDLSDETMKLITSLPLQTLNLKSSKFAKKWLDSIARMKTLTTLTINYVPGCSNEDYIELESRMPWCSVRGLDSARHKKREAEEVFMLAPGELLPDNSD